MPTDGTATRAMQRMLFFGISLFAIAFAGLGASQGATERPTLDPTWYGVSSAVLLALPVVIAAASPRAPLRLLRALAGLEILAYSVVLLTWPLAIAPDAPFDLARPWVFGHLLVVMSFGGVLLPEIAAWVFLVGLAAASGLLRVWAQGPAIGLSAVEDAVSNLMFGAVLVAITQATLRAGRTRDAAAAATARSLAASASVTATNLQRARAMAIIHDDVISTLIAAARFDDGPLVRGYAGRALGRLDTLRTTALDPERDIPSGELVATLRAASATLARDTELHASGPEITLPPAVGAAVIEAAAEALRNSERHAGSATVRRTVVVETRTGGLVVRIADDGCGFDIRQVPSERFGIAVSIRGRMAAVGGSSVIDSATGAGTVVTLDWTAP